MSQDILYNAYVLKFLRDSSYQDFLDDVCTHENIAYISLTFPIEAVDPLACLEILSSENEFRYFWEIPQQDFAIAAGKEVVSLRASGPSRFRQIHDQINDVKTRTAEYSAVSHGHSGLNFVGGFAFHDENQDSTWESFDAASFSVPEWVVIRDGKLGLLTITLDISQFGSAAQLQEEVHSRLRSYSDIFSLHSAGLPENPVSEAVDNKFSPNQSRKAYVRWIESVKKAKEYISKNQFKKIVLAREFRIDTEKKLAPTQIINDLRQQYPNCYSFLIGRQDAKTFIGCSPERLAAFRKHFLLTEALAGSIQRGATATEDAVFAGQLLNSSKNADEHNFVIKAIKQKLQPFALQIDQDEHPSIKKFTNVQHLYTPITVRLNGEPDHFSILNELHPTPAVGGYPWEKASVHIQELEHFDRGWYAGMVGWLNSHGDGEFTVAIRSGLIQENTARFFAGCGIVADSNPEAEWQETSLKLIPMLSALRYD